MKDSAPDGSEPLSAMFRRLIASCGPISLMHFMGESNARYYAGKDPLGAAGDFITAPEISQMFGELIGLWLADIWIRAGRPSPVAYVELGPGRGTLASDALRAARRHGLDPDVHFVEASSALREVQLSTVPDATWHADLSSLPDDCPILLVANEFLDALPIRQLVRTQGGWRERMVAVSEGEFVAIAGDQPMDAAVPARFADAGAGTLVEACPGAATVVQEIAARLVRQGGAALLIDYGHDAPRTGSTLQALREHRKVDPFAHPGEADLTAHVDFAALAEVAGEEGCRLLGTVPQGQWLLGMGIEARAAGLVARSPDQADAIRSAMDRLVSPAQMGELFKVMGLAAPGWPDGAAFPPAE